jgi:hypothetical protein
MRPSGLAALIRPGRRHKVTSYWPAAEVCLVAVPPGPQQPNPGRQNPGALHPAGFPPGQLPPGQVLPWRARYGPPPARDALIFARIMLGIQAGLSSLILLTAPLAFFDKPLPPGVTSQYGDLQAPSLTRNIIMLLVSVACWRHLADACGGLRWPRRPRSRSSTAGSSRGWPLRLRLREWPRSRL